MLTRIEGNPNATPAGFYVWADHGQIIELFWFREEKKTHNAYRSLLQTHPESQVSGRAA